MTRIHAATALLPDGWARDIIVEIGLDGRISEVIEGTGGDHSVGLLLPAPANLHSHAFQRAMAGLSERRGPARDSFWTWRALMFRFLDQLSPDDIEAITAFVQMEMLEAGFASVGEFHYLHHQPGGKPYGKLGELSERVAAATQISGIGLTLLPVLYEQGGVDGSELTAGQVRFGNDVERFLRLHAEATETLKSLPLDAQIGVAPHSLRAVSREAFAQLPKGLTHMHLAEQIPEVEEVQFAFGARPVEWALENLGIDQNWCLIHCTQMQPHETTALAATGATAGLCPITESSLGDGIFDAARWLEHGGRIGIGSDSNIRIALSEELRTLEYSQRLRDHGRAVLATPQLSTGRRLYEATLNGAAAIGRESGRIAPTQWGDLVALDASAINLTGREGDTALDAWIFAGDDSLVRDVWSAGRHVVQEGQHVSSSEISERYRRTILRLKDVI